MLRNNAVSISSLSDLTYREKTVYSTTHKTAINRPMEHTGPDETHILSKVTCFFYWNPFISVVQKQQGFFPKQIPILRKLRNKCRLVSDAHISDWPTCGYRNSFQQGMKTIYDKQLRDTDQLRFLRNCPPTPPLTQHFAKSEKLLLTLGLGRSRWTVSLNWSD